MKIITISILFLVLMSFSVIASSPKIIEVGTGIYDNYVRITTFGGPEFLDLNFNNMNHEVPNYNTLFPQDICPTYVIRYEDNADFGVSGDLVPFSCIVGSDLKGLNVQFNSGTYTGGSFQLIFDPCYQIKYLETFNDGTPDYGDGSLYDEYALKCIDWTVDFSGTVVTVDFDYIYGVDEIKIPYSGLLVSNTGGPSNSDVSVTGDHTGGEILIQRTSGSPPLSEGTLELTFAYDADEGGVSSIELGHSMNYEPDYNDYDGQNIQYDMAILGLAKSQSNPKEGFSSSTCDLVTIGSDTVTIDGNPINENHINRFEAEQMTITSTEGGAGNSVKIDTQWAIAQDFCGADFDSDMVITTDSAELYKNRVCVKASQYQGETSTITITDSNLCPTEGTKIDGQSYETDSNCNFLSPNGPIVEYTCGASNTVVISHTWASGIEFGEQEGGEEPSEAGGVPEFSTIGVILMLVIVSLGYTLIITKRKNK